MYLCNQLVFYIQTLFNHVKESYLVSFAKYIPWVMCHVHVQIVYASMTSWPSLLVSKESITSNIDFVANFAGLEKFNSDKSKCQEHFDIYKECKKKEVMDLLQIWKCSVVCTFHCFIHSTSEKNCP